MTASTCTASFDLAASEALLKVPATVGNATLVIQVTDPQTGMQASTQVQTAY
ncbi:hypothetical protein [Rhabdochromatium marinum]|uniref:hypothetical protein n=1 Tax=Rhabdochromatium marinum TaxID=48729 RepID=UPI001907E9DD|nr:hypothetical protein [Rhabdochromatium marinum]